MTNPWVEHAKQRRIRRILGAVAFLSAPWVVPRIEPVALGVDAAVVFPDTVNRGQMGRQVRGSGTFLPETVVVIAASHAGRVERPLVAPGQAVVPGTVLVELSSPQALCAIAACGPTCPHQAAADARRAALGKGRQAQASIRDGRWPPANERRGGPDRLRGQEVARIADASDPRAGFKVPETLVNALGSGNVPRSTRGSG